MKHMFYHDTFVIDPSGSGTCCKRNLLSITVRSLLSLRTIGVCSVDFHRRLLDNIHLFYYNLVSFRTNLVKKDTFT